MPRFGMPSHTDPPVHAPLNPTEPYRPPPAEPSWQPMRTPVSGPTPGAAVPFVYGASSGPRRKSMWIAVVLAVVLGPLGLFYVGLWNGIAALVVLPAAIPYVLARIAAATGGNYQEMISTVGVPLIWCFTVPWALIATAVRNSRIP